MAPKLSDLLINEGLITPMQLEEALKCQVIFGGRLGTNLVEMNMVKESDVVRCLSKQLEMPFVSAEQLMSVPQEIINLIPKEIAEQFKIVPLSLEKKRLTVAMLDPSDLAAIDEISFMTGYIILPVVCSELRVLHALEQYYGIKRELRFIKLSGGTGNRSREAAPSDLSPREDVISPDWFEVNGLNEVPLPLELDINAALLNMPVDEEIIDLDELAPQITAHAKPSPLSAALVPPPTAAVRLQQTDSQSREAIMSAFTETEHRDEIGDAADCVCRNAERVALFMVKGKTAAGCKARIPNKVLVGFENFQLALDEPSALKVVVDTGRLYLGPIMDTAGNRKLLAALGGGAPETVLLMPLMMEEKVVAIFYVDGVSELAQNLERLQGTAGMAGLAFETLHPLLFQ